MPAWAQFVLGAAAVVAAIGVLARALWTKILRPGAKAIGLADDLRPLVSRLDALVPLLEDMVTQFAKSPHAFEILDDIIAQFRNDSGSSLRDAVDGLTASAESTKQAAKAAAIATEAGSIQLEAAKRIAAQDRAQVAELASQVARMIMLADLLNDKVTASDLRDAKVAELLATAQIAVDGVALDLARAHERAESVDSSHHGAAADASARMTKAEVEIVEQDPTPESP